MDLPQGRAFVLLACHSETTQLGPSAVAQLHRLSLCHRERAIANDVSSWQSQKRQVLSTMMVRLGVCLITSEFRMFAGCGAR